MKNEPFGFRRRFENQTGERLRNIVRKQNPETESPSFHVLDAIANDVGLQPMSATELPSSPQHDSQTIHFNDELQADNSFESKADSNEIESSPQKENKAIDNAREPIENPVLNHPNSTAV